LVVRPLIAIVVAIQVLFAGWGLIRRSVDGLMDKAIPEAERRAIETALESVRREGCDYHQLRTRQAASKHFADVHLLVPGVFTVQQGHDLMERIEREVARTAPNVELLIHLEPLEDPKSWDEPGKPMVGS
jgi:divalent metal cation (Fe/Co/Zn/Cd) transporter